MADAPLLDRLRAEVDRFRGMPYGHIHVGRALTKLLRDRFGSKAYFALRDCQDRARASGDPFVVDACDAAEKFMSAQLPPEHWAPERKTAGS